MNQTELVKAFAEALKKTEERDSIAFSELAERYYDYQCQHRKTAKRDIRYIDCYLMPRLKHEPINKISRFEMEQIISTLSRRAPVASNRLLSVAKRMFNLAIRWELIEKNPCAHIEKQPEKSRTRFLSEEGLVRVFHVLEDYKTVPSLFFLLILHTGMRHSEARYLTWKQVDLENQVIVLTQTKNGRDHQVGIPESLVPYFESLKFIRQTFSQYVFASDKCPKHTIATYKHWRQIREQANVKDVTIHDLRRTFASHLVMNGTSREEIGNALNQKSLKATAIYTVFERGFAKKTVKKASDIYSGILHQ